MGNFLDFLKSDAGRSLMASGVEAGSSYASRRAGQNIIKNEGTAQEESGKKLYEKMLAELRSGKFDVSQEKRDAAEDQKIAAEQFIENSRQFGENSRGDLIAGIQSGDPRMSGLIPKQTQAIQQQLQQAELQGLKIRDTANSGIADLEQAALEKQAALSEFEMNRGGEGAASGRDMRLQAMLNQKQAAGDAIGDGINTGISVYGALSDPSAPKNNDGTPDYDGDKTNSYEDGGVVDFEDGGGMTNGEFSHEDNAKAIIDEDTGVKEGEVTGGELVFNVEQSDTIEELINSGKGAKLIKYLKNLLSKEQFQA